MTGISPVTSKTGYMPQALADLDANTKVADTAGQQTAPAQGTTTDAATAAPSNSLRGLLADPRITCQLPGAAGSCAPNTPANVPGAPPGEKEGEGGNLGAGLGADLGEIIGNAAAGAMHFPINSLDAAVAVLRGNFSVFADAKKDESNQFITKGDLEAVRDSPNYDQSLRDAAAYVFAHPGALKFLDISAKGDDPDDRISIGDLDSFGTGSANALRTLQDHFDLFDTARDGGQGDGNISKDDLMAVINKENFFAGRNLTSEQEKEVTDAAYYLVNHRGAFNAAHCCDDSKGNGISRDGIGAYLGRYA